MAAESGEFVVVPVAAHLQDCGSESEPVAEDKDRDAGPGVVARDHRVLFADRSGRLSVADTNGADVFARERGVSSREAVMVKNRSAWLGLADGFARQHDMSSGDGEALLGMNLPPGVRVVDSVAREIDAPFLGMKFFGDDYFAFKNGEPSFAGLVPADEHGVRSGKVRMKMMAAGEALRAAPSAPHAEQVTIDALLGAMADEEAGAEAGGRGVNLSTVTGIVAASSAVTMLAAGAVPVSPPVAFGTFLLLLGGLFLAVYGVVKN